MNDSVLQKNIDLTPEADGSIWVVLSRLGIPDVNGYTKEPLTESQIDDLKKQISEKRFCGELGLPARLPGMSHSSFMRRISEVNLTHAAFEVLEIRVTTTPPTQLIEGRIRLYQPGMDAAAVKPQDKPLYFGMRAFTRHDPTKPNGSMTITQIVAWDIVKDDPYAAVEPKETVKDNGTVSLTEPLVQPVGTETKKRMIYPIDEWLEAGAVSDTMRDKSLAYAHFMFSYFREPAWMKSIHAPFYEGRKLFVDYEGKTWQVTGASRLGDIWLKQLKPLTTAFYDKRIDLDFSKLSNWRATVS